MAEKPEIMSLSSAAIYTTADPFDQGVRALLHDQLYAVREITLFTAATRTFASG